MKASILTSVCREPFTTRETNAFCLFDNPTHDTLNSKCFFAPAKVCFPLQSEFLLLLDLRKSELELNSTSRVVAIAVAAGVVVAVAVAVAIAIAIAIAITVTVVVVLLAAFVVHLAQSDET